MENDSSDPTVRCQGNASSSGTNSHQAIRLGSVQNLASQPRRAALYARQSNADPDGIDRQIPRLRKLAAERGWAIAGEYVDDGMSASKSSWQGRQARFNLQRRP